MLFLYNLPFNTKKIREKLITEKYLHNFLVKSSKIDLFLSTVISLCEGIDIP